MMLLIRVKRFERSQTRQSWRKQIGWGQTKCALLNQNILYWVWSQLQKMSQVKSKERRIYLDDLPVKSWESTFTNALLPINY